MYLQDYKSFYGFKQVCIKEGNIVRLLPIDKAIAMYGDRYVEQEIDRTKDYLLVTMGHNAQEVIDEINTKEDASAIAEIYLNEARYEDYLPVKELLKAKGYHWWHDISTSLNYVFRTKEKLEYFLSCYPHPELDYVDNMN